ncbi:MAG: protoheme IX farnesyltransferase [Desulfamplus sp.]|nr:protoheme IX farnesyltransferase [Desulfamplus sp.]
MTFDKLKRIFSRNNLFNTLCSHIKVSKVLISLGITSSSMVGYLICFPYADRTFWITAFSSFLLCAGGGTLNNYQDRHIDKLLQRTSKRPLPSGSVSETSVLVQAFLLILSGSTGFCFTRNPPFTVFLALIGIIFYNGVYTPLKSRTLLSIFPGVICGMIPPLMGWSAAGGSLFSCVDINSLGSNGDILLWVMAVLGVWQIPHFWLILLRHADDYEETHSKYILPSMLVLFSRSQLRRIMLIWILLYSVMLVMIPLFYSGLSRTAQWIVVCNGAGMFIFFAGLHFSGSARDSKMEFIILNGSMVLFIIILIINILEINIT